MAVGVANGVAVGPGVDVGIGAAVGDGRIGAAVGSGSALEHCTSTTAEMSSSPRSCKLTARTLRVRLISLNVKIAVMVKLG
jgi:hypothetical protein